MKFLRKFNFIFFFNLLFWSFIVFWLFLKPKYDTKKKSLSGEVNSVMKLERNAGYEVIITEGNKRRKLTYPFKEMSIGDSIFKFKNSSTLYIKFSGDSLMHTLKGTDYLLFN